MSALRRSPRIAAKQAPVRDEKNPFLDLIDVAKAKARADIDARTKHRVAQLRAPKPKPVKGTDAYYAAVIRPYLNMVDAARGSDAKIAAATGLLNFIYSEAVPFVKKHRRFHDVLVNKCYELKRAHQLMDKDAPAFIVACNRLLKALGQPLEQTLKPETMTKLELTTLIEQLTKYRERASRDV